MHAGVKRAEGRADIVRGRSLLAQLICTLARMPGTGAGVPIETTFDVIDGGERWTRRFNGQPFQTDLILVRPEPGAELTEQFGLLVFRLQIIAHENGIDLIPQGVSILGLPLPKIFCPEAVGLERVRDGRYYFDVCVSFPLAGEVLRYQGWLAPVE
jgi:hypothetical protein